jgi:glycosyltransferase involved in cell wall biosynthesis
MTDILIKSFNRPYYLDRCLQSIYLNVKGNFTITIMDDGTPEQYLTKILKTYPQIKIIRSVNYSYKSNLVQNLNAKPNKNQEKIPVDLWVNCVKQSSNIFLLLEEDSWFTKSIDLHEVRDRISQHKLDIIKLGWNNNPQVVQGEKISLSSTLEEIKPHLPLINQRVLSLLLKNTFKLRSILLKTKILPAKFFLPYYSLYTVTSAFFNKAYWLHLWSTSQQHVDEMVQL